MSIIGKKTYLRRSCLLVFDNGVMHLMMSLIVSHIFLWSDIKGGRTRKKM
jgi:hypothetical protein